MQVSFWISLWHPLAAIVLYREVPGREKGSGWNLFWPSKRGSIQPICSKHSLPNGKECAQQVSLSLSLPLPLLSLSLSLLHSHTHVHAHPFTDANLISWSSFDIDSWFSFCRFPDISSIQLKMPNLHFLPVNISSKDNPAIVKVEWLSANTLVWLCNYSDEMHPLLHYKLPRTENMFKWMRKHFR